MRLGPAGRPKLASGGRTSTDPETVAPVALPAPVSIATTTGLNESGLFETNLRDDRFLLFEGRGVTSRVHWRSLARANGTRYFMAACGAMTPARTRSTTTAGISVASATRRDTQLFERRKRRASSSSARAGFTPDVRFETTDRATVLGLVSAGLGVAFLPASARRMSGRRVRFREVPWLPLRSRLDLVLRASGAPPAATRLAALLGGGSRRASHAAASS